MVFIVGVCGDLDIGIGFGYDVSVQCGLNCIDFFIKNIINVFLGFDILCDFVSGG